MKRWPIGVILVALLLTALAAWKVTSLRPESSIDGLLNPGDPATAAMGRVMREFPLAEELLVFVSLPAGDDDASKLTAFAERLSTHLSSETAFVVAARWRAGDSVRDFVQKVMAPAGLLYLSDDQLSAAELRLTPAGMREQIDRNAAILAAPGPAAGGLAKAIAQDPLRLHEFLLAALKAAGLPAAAASGSDTFATQDGRGLLVRIEGRRPPGDLSFSADLVRVVRQAITKSHPATLDVRVSGAYAIAAHNAAVIRGDSIESSVASTAALGLLFVVLYRRPVKTFLLAFVPVVMGLVWGFGLYACFRETITPLAAVIGGVLGGVGIDYPVHLMAHRRENETPAGTVRRLSMPLVAAFVTSVVGFVAVYWSPLRVLRDFAMIGSLGLAGAWLATMTVLPALLTIVGEQGVGAAATRGMPAAKLWPSIAANPPALTRLGLVMSLLAIGIASLCVSGLKEDADLAALHPRPNPPLDALDDINTRMAGGGGAFVALVTAADDASLLATSWRVRHALAGSGVSAFGPASLLPDPVTARDRISQPRDVGRIVADFKAAVADSAFVPGAFDRYADFLPTLLRPQASPTITDLRRYPELAQTMLSRSGSAAMVQLTPTTTPKTPTDVTAMVAGLRERLSGIDGVVLTGTGTVSSDTRQAARRDAGRIAVTAAAAVLAMLLIHLRSLTLAMLTVLPTAFSFACVLIAMRLFDFGVNVVHLVMFPLLLGITIDYGIFVTDVLRPGVTDKPPERFLAATTALLTCVATTFIGFGSLVTTSVPAVRSLGWLINIGLLACMIGAHFVLWPVVLTIARKRGRL